jgi:threonylcarbamoyladenosine tRNA methylthiotransferase MtaB
MPSRRVHLQTLGCRLNEAELETWTREFRARGWELAAQPELAELVVVNTCAVTAEATRKSRQLLRRSRRANPLARLVVSGCYATLDAERAAGELGFDLLVPNGDKHRLVELSIRAFDLPTMPVHALEADAQPLLARGRQRAFVKVQDGCRYRCSYCVVTLARGSERSRPITEVVDEVNALHRGGIQEVVLTGVHLGGYGSDSGATLVGLVDTVLAHTEVPRLRLGSLEPWDLPGDFWDRFRNPRLLPHLHLPIQSGSDAVLRRMSRRCRTAEFRDLVAEGRQRVPDLNVTTDIIVGFPGETEREWQETLAFVDEMRFGHVHIFAYSPRPGTKAASLPEQLPRATKRIRSEELHALAARHRRRVLEAYLGQESPVLVEQAVGAAAGARHWVGYTPNYLKVGFAAPTAEDLENRILRVRTEAVSEDGEALVGRWMS